MEQQKTLGNTDANGARKNVSDIVFFGNGDTFKLICKASSKAEGWMKSTKAMEIPGSGCVVQVTTQQRNLDGSYSVAEALTYVPYTKIRTIFGGVPEGVTEFNEGDYPVIGREIVADNTFSAMIGESISSCGPGCNCASDSEKQA